MGRNILIPRDAIDTIYFPIETDIDDHIDFDFLIEDIITILQQKYPSLENTVSHRLFEDRENRVILMNSICRISITEYIGLIALSFMPDNGDYYNLGCNWIYQNTPNIEKLLTKNGFKIVHKQGTMSNGVSIYI